MKRTALIPVVLLTAVMAVGCGKSSFEDVGNSINNYYKTEQKSDDSVEMTNLNKVYSAVNAALASESAFVAAKNTYSNKEVAISSILKSSDAFAKEVSDTLGGLDCTDYYLYFDGAKGSVCVYKKGAVKAGDTTSAQAKLGIKYSNSNNRYMVLGDTKLVETIK